MHDDLIARMRHLVSLNGPEHGGPYGGAAAEDFVRTMTRAANALEALCMFHTERPDSARVNATAAKMAEETALHLRDERPGWFWNEDDGTIEARWVLASIVRQVTFRIEDAYTYDRSVGKITEHWSPSPSPTVDEMLIGLRKRGLSEIGAQNRADGYWVAVTQDGAETSFIAPTLRGACEAALEATA